MLIGVLAQRLLFLLVLLVAKLLAPRQRCPSGRPSPFFDDLATWLSDHSTKSQEETKRKIIRTNFCIT
uniref:Putative secreted peptide n=1 Tax=Anopheles braziliensis TaxID=58242 RepID=A0A2M3ZU11_9DIPT